MKKAWSIKHLTSRGIEVVKGELSPNPLYFRGNRSGTIWVQRLGTEVFLTESEAIAAAINQRAKLIASAEKRLAKLRAMRFDAAEHGAGEGEG